VAKHAESFLLIAFFHKNAQEAINKSILQKDLRRTEEKRN
jgi:hypothetical protein